MSAIYFMKYAKVIKKNILKFQSLGLRGMSIKIKLGHHRSKSVKSNFYLS